MEFIASISEEYLPKEWRNVIVPEKSTTEVIHIRCNITCPQDCDAWKNSFAQITNTQWIMRNSKPDSSMKLVCQKIYVCHHSSYRKRPVDENNCNKRGISKNTSCQAFLSATVKVTTAYTRRNDPYIKDGMPGIIRIRTHHNHPLNSPSTLKHLSPFEHVQKDFRNYFEMGMNIAAACRYHQNKIFFENYYDLTDNGKEENLNRLENSRINPTQRKVQMWFQSWRKEKYGPRNGSDMKQILDSRIAVYESQGTTIKYTTSEELFALVIATPMMLRVHESSFSKDILFVDSTSCCNREKLSITFALSAFPCGAIPCGAIITKNQMMASFTAGFKLLQEIIAEKVGASFSSQNYPTVIMSDNSSAEIGGFSAVWPKSVSLLCTFHVLQYVMRWLQDSSHKIPKERQKDLMSSFQTILYCTDKNEVFNAYESAIAIGQDFPAWQKYLTDQYNMREKWCLAYRAHDTNNYAEISIRLFKENVLNLVKAYNMIALIDFIAVSMEIFFREKLRDFYCSRNRKNYLGLQSILKKTEYLQPGDIVKIDEYAYTVPSENTPGMIYYIDSRTGFCNCEAGAIGKLCKHTVALHKFLDLESLNISSVTIEELQLMAFVALGKEKIPSYDYFLSLHFDIKTEREYDLGCQISDNIARLDYPACCESPASVIGIDNIENVPDLLTYESPEIVSSEILRDDTNQENTDLPMSETPGIDSSNILQVCQNSNSLDHSCPMFKKVLNSMMELNSKFGQTHLAEQGALKFFQRLDKIASREQWVSFLHTVGKSVPLHRAVNAKIKVQPTAIQSRKSKTSQLVSVKRCGKITPKKVLISQ